MSIFVCLSDHGFYFSKSECSAEPAFVSYDDQNAVDLFFKGLSSGTKIDVLIDVIEEELELVSIPKVYPWEKSKVLAINERKVFNKRILFVNSRFIQDGQNHFIRFYKIFKNSGISSFLQRCEECQFLITGIYVAELLIEGAIGRLRFDKDIKKAFNNDVVLLVIRRSDFTYKQIVFKKGVVELVRTVEIPEDVSSIIDAYDYVTRECDMTIKYLYNAKIIDYGKSINMVFVDRDEVRSHQDSLAALIDTSLVVKSEWDDEVFNLYFSSFADILPARSHKGIKINDLVTFSMCLMSRVSFLSTHVATDAVSLVRTALGLKKIFAAISLIFLFVGGYYIGSLASRYFFLIDSIDYISAQNKRLQTIKKDLTEKIKIPYDARDLKALVEFSQSYPDERDKTSILHIISAIANVLNSSPEIKLVKINIKRYDQASKLLPSRYSIDAQFALTNADVLYEENIKRMRTFADKISSVKGFSDVSFKKLPVEVEPNRAQALDSSMLMPVSLPFEIKWVWVANDK